MIIMLHNVQRILGIGINGSLPAESADGDWKLALAGLYGKPMSKLRRKGYFTRGSINVGEGLHMCHRSQALETQSTAYYMAIVGSTLLVDNIRTGMRPHPILTVNVDQDERAHTNFSLCGIHVPSKYRTTLLFLVDHVATIDSHLFWNSATVELLTKGFHLLCLNICPC